MAEIYFPDGSKLSDYLLLSAGSTKPLTGDLYLKKPDPGIYFHTSADVHLFDIENIAGVTYIDSLSGDMEFHVPTGCKFKFVVG